VDGDLRSTSLRLKGREMVRMSRRRRRGEGERARGSLAGLYQEIAP
jgi:hypothetical protein